MNKLIFVSQVIIIALLVFVHSKLEERQTVQTTVVFKEGAKIKTDIEEIKELFMGAIIPYD